MRRWHCDILQPFTRGRRKARSCRPKERGLALQNFPESWVQAPAQAHSFLPNILRGRKSPTDTFPRIHKWAPTSYYRPEFNLFNIRNTNDAYLRHPVKSL